jgi:hypothetical protein
VERREYERLKATLHNAGRMGPAAQNRQQHPRFKEHLEGRVSLVNHLNPARGQKLLVALGRIDWNDTAEP